ncbi:alpha/beta hydrolase [Streptomycetaceae bacterium NBC_01309]
MRGRSEVPKLVETAVQLGVTVRDPAPPRAFRFAHDGCRLHGLDWGGTGVPVLLLHGGGLTAHTWDFVCLGLRGAARLVALDLRGHGDSDWSDDCRVGTMAADVVAAADHLGFARVRLVGMSLGGVVAAHVAAARPDRVERLALVDVAPGVDFESTGRIREFMSGLAPVRDLGAVVEAAMRVNPRAHRASVAYRMSTLFRRAPDGGWVPKGDPRPPDFPAILAAIGRLAELAAGVRVLLVRGGRSRVLPQAAAERLVGRLPDAELAVVPDAGHNVQEDNPAALVTALRTFVAPGPAESTSAPIRRVRRMTTREYRYWSSAERFQSLVEELAPLDMGEWLVRDVEAAVAALGWDLLPVPPGRVVDLARGPLDGVGWELGLPPRGPRQGIGVVVGADDGVRPRAVRLEVNLGTGIAYDDDHRDEVDFVRTAWDVMQEILGTPPTLWAGAGLRWDSPGPRMLWRRPGGTTLAVGLDVHSAPVMSMLHTVSDGDAAGSRGMSPGVWRAGEPADLPSLPEPEPRVTTTWEWVESRLAKALRALCADTPCLPGAFVLHLQSARDQLCFVSAWNEGLDMRIESFVHHAERADANLLAQRGWSDAGGLWQRRFDNAVKNGDHADTAATMLVEAIRAMGVDDPNELNYHGTVSGRGHHFQLELPHLRLARMAEPVD